MSNISRGPASSLLAVTALLLPLSLAACGGGGGGGSVGGTGGGGGSGTTGAIEGTITLPDEDWGMVAENEPNGTIAQAQVLPPLQPRSTVVVAGEIGAVVTRFGVLDLTDALRVVSHVTQDLQLTLTTRNEGFVSADLALAVVQTGTGNPIGSVSTFFNPEVLTVTLAADVPVDVVVTCLTGAGGYTLEFETMDPIATTSASRPAPAVLSQSEIPSEGAIDYLLNAPDCADTHVLVRARSGDAAQRIARAMGGRVLRRTGAGTYLLGFTRTFSDTGGRDACAHAARLAADPDVEGAEPDWIVRALAVPNDPDFNREWSLEAVGCTSAWDITYGDPSIVVGIIDTGIIAHPDLDPQVVGGYDFISDPNTALDGTSRDPDPTDEGTHDEPNGTSSWHGSHVAGLIAARANDGYGMCGLAPGCRIMPLRAIGRSGGLTSDLADALRYAAGLDATATGPALAAPLRVVNMSLGSPQGDNELKNAVKAAIDAGVILVAAAGNDGVSGVYFPAAYPGVIAVGAVDGRLVYATYSNTGPQIALVAPGGNENRDVGGDGFQDAILSTVKDETVKPAIPGQAYYSGTSMAVPHVAAAAALVLSVDPTLTPEQVRSTLTSSCRDLDAAGADVRTGAGLLQVGEAVRLALANIGAPRVDPPRLLLSSDTVRISFTESVRTVNVSNGGGGTLHIESVHGSADGITPWLSAFTAPGSVGAPSDVSSISIVATRGSLPPGTYAGSVLVFGTTQVLGSIRVILEVGSHPLTGIPFIVSAIDSTSGQTRLSGYVDANRNYHYVLQGLLPGKYRVRAGTDLDGDGTFGEANDWTGDYGGTTSLVVTLGSGQRLEGIDISLHK